MTWMQHAVARMKALEGRLLRNIDELDSLIDHWDERARPVVRGFPSMIESLPGGMPLKVVAHEIGEQAAERFAEDYTLTATDLALLPERRSAKEAIDHWRQKVPHYGGNTQSKRYWNLPDVVQMDARDAELRRQSTDFGNLVADCVRIVYQADVAILNAGCFRADRHLELPLSIIDLRETFLFDELKTLPSVVCLELTLDEVRAILWRGIRFTLDVHK